MPTPAIGTGRSAFWRRKAWTPCESSAPSPLDAGVFAENINTRGIDLKHLPVGTRLRVGETELEVTQIGKQCHNDCEIKRTAGKCVIPTEGIFAVVVKEGRVQAGDKIEVLK